MESFYCLSFPVKWKKKLEMYVYRDLKMANFPSNPIFV